MREYSRPLGDTIRNARKERALTQLELAESLDIGNRTITNIENYNSNPSMDVLFPLIRHLHVDPSIIFYPERTPDAPSVRALHLLASSCTEEEAKALLPICQSVLSALRKNEESDI